MDNNELKGILHQNLPEPALLANMARAEKRQLGKISAVCPKCKSILSVTEYGNRNRVTCECGYIRDEEIVF